MNNSNKGFSVVPILVILAVVAVAAIAYFVLHGLGIGTGFGTGDGEGDGNTQIETNQDNINDEETENVSEEETDEQNVSKMNTFSGEVVKVCVAGNDYIYDSEKIELEDLISLIKTNEEEIVVELIDDDASKKAYELLVEKLEEARIDYVEK